MDQRIHKITFILIGLLLTGFGLSSLLFPAPARAAEDAPEPAVVQVVLEPGRTDTSIDLFLSAYGGTVLSDNTVIAPGTENAVSVRFTEPNGFPFSYKAFVRTEVLQAGVPVDLDLPLLVSVNGGAEKAFSAWSSEGDGVPVSSGSLSAGREGSVDLSWKWAFERGDDAGDVALSALRDLSAVVRVVIITESEAPADETAPSSETGAPETNAPSQAPTDTPSKPSRTNAPSTEAPSRSSGSRNTTPFGVDDSPAGIIVILVLAAVLGIVLIVLYKRRKPRND